MRPARRSLHVPWAPAVGRNAEQVHVVPSDTSACSSGAGGEAKVMFASSEWRRDGWVVTYVRANSSEAKAQSATAVASAYSDLLYVEAEDMLAPVLGPQTVGGVWNKTDDEIETAPELAWAQNTTWWNANKSFAAYYNPAKKGVDDNNLKYKNPMNVYTSPVLYTATLTGLVCGAAYTYVVEDGATAPNYTFTMPQPGMEAGKTYTWGVTADLGQTPVSDRSVSELAANKPDVVP